MIAFRQRSMRVSIILVQPSERGTKSHFCLMYEAAPALLIAFSDGHRA